MKIKWRDDDYDFNPGTLFGKQDEWNRNSDRDSPIFGADTESVETEFGYEPQCFTFAGTDGSWYKEIDPGAIALWDFLNFIAENYDELLLQEKKAFIYFHNLEYDFLQLVKYHPTLLEMAKIGVSPEKDVVIGRINGYSAIMKKDGLFRGSAPHFTIRLESQVGKQRVGFDLKFRDTFSYFPGSLDKVSKDLKLGVEKMKRQEDLGQRDFRIESMSDDKKYFIEYAKIDADNTRLIAEKIRDLHEVANMTKIRPSSPGYAINRLLHLMGEERKIITGSHDPEIMQLIFDTYRGGRTGGIYHGEVKDIRVYDFHSSYPASMCSLPSFSENMGYVRVDDCSNDNVLAILQHTGNALLRVSGTETDERYPSLITQHDGKLTPVFGEFENISTTGHEFYLGVMSGGLKDWKVHEMIVLLDMEDKPFLPFKVFAETSYKEKAESKKGSVAYVAAKLKLNSAYGKLIESRHNTMIGASDGHLYVPFIEGMEKAFGQYYYGKLIEAYDNGNLLDDCYEELIAELHTNFDETVMNEMKCKMLMDFPLTGMIYGKYVVPAAASLITAISRTRLCATMKALGALYWDTDSVFIKWDDSFSEEEELYAKLKQTDSWLAGGLKPIRVGDELGDLDCECYKSSGVLAGIKRYYLEGVDEKGESVLKAASHGLPAIDKTKMKDTLYDLARGYDSMYKSKPKPLKAKESPSPELIGAFRDKMYHPGFHLDTRLDWVKIDGGWMGTMKWLKSMEESSIDPRIEQLVMEGLFDDE